MMAATNMLKHSLHHHQHHNHCSRSHLFSKRKQRRRSLARDLGPRESPKSFEPKHVVIVMDATRDFSVETLEWVLKNIALEPCCTITLLGVKPWLTFVSSCKTWTDVWTMSIEDLFSMKDTGEWKNDVRCHKAQGLIDLCAKYGVAPQIEIGQGFPQRSLVLERITSSYATWVVFDRYHNRKDVEYVAKKVPCNILVMNNEGEADMIRGRSATVESSEESPAWFASFTSSSASSPIPTPKLMLSDSCKRILSGRIP